MNPNDILGRCLAEAQTELNKITCYDTKPKLDLSYKSYRYVNGEFIEEAEGDRGEVFRKTVADSPKEFVEYLLYSSIKSFAFSYECRHRRPFEDNRRQVNEIIENCYACLDGKYEYTLMVHLKDNIHIYFDLLDYYVKVSREALEKYPLPGEVKRRLTFIAEKHYAARTGGMYDVAFSFEWVRYQIERILESEEIQNVGGLGLRKTFLQHEEQYKRLRELEKIDPDNAEKYQLGTWDRAVFKGAEEILEGGVVLPNTPESITENVVFRGMTARFIAAKRCSKRNTKGSVDGGTTEAMQNISKEAACCALYMLIILIHTKRDVDKDVKRLITLAKTVDVTPFENQLKELFVTDRYGVFHRGEYAGSRELAREELGI